MAENSELKGIIEALLFVAGEPLSPDRIKNILEEVDKKQYKVYYGNFSMIMICAFQA